ncbi:MAG: hypothetical protein JST82_01375 [Bacteroidetes bacterium]|nr:hypothetical protein [Bacteroidota bacterium]
MMRYLFILLLFASLSVHAQRIRPVYNEPEKTSKWREGRVMMVLSSSYGPAFPYVVSDNNNNEHTNNAGIGFVNFHVLFRNPATSPMEGFAGVSIGGFGFGVVQPGGNTLRAGYGLFRLRGGGNYVIPMSKMLALHITAAGGFGLGVGIESSSTDLKGIVTAEGGVDICFANAVTAGLKYIVVPGRFTSRDNYPHSTRTYIATSGYGIQGLMMEVGWRIGKYGR